MKQAQSLAESIWVNSPDKTHTAGVLDIVFIGAGLHEQNMQNYLNQNHRELHTLTIEREELVASTFALGKKAFNLNSSSKDLDSSSLRQRLRSGFC